MSEAVFGDEVHHVRISDDGGVVTISSPLGNATRRVYALGFGFSRFLNQLQRIHSELNGSAAFEALEGDFSLEFAIAPLGALTAKASLREQYSASEFKIEIDRDQTFLPPFIAAARSLKLSSLDVESA